MIRLVRKLGRFLLYGGFAGPKPYETAMLNAVAAALPESDAQSLGRQIALIERLQRWKEDRMVIVGFEDKGMVPKLQNQATDHCLAKLRLKGSFGSIGAAVMTHRGILSSLEFRQSPRKTAGHAVTVEILALHASDPRISRSIDEEEHR